MVTACSAPRDALEARVVRIWEEVLGIAPIGIDDDFFDLGGESLHAFAVIARVLRDFDVALVPSDLFACASAGAMAAVIAERQREQPHAPVLPAIGSRKRAVPEPVPARPGADSPPSTTPAPAGAPGADPDASR